MCAVYIHTYLRTSYTHSYHPYRQNGHARLCYACATSKPVVEIRKRPGPDSTATKPNAPGDEGADSVLASASLGSRALQWLLMLFLFERNGPHTLRTGWAVWNDNGVVVAVVVVAKAGRCMRLCFLRPSSSRTPGGAATRAPAGHILCLVPRVLPYLHSRPVRVHVDTNGAC